ncbi:hypothetical protein TorRG33x02_007290, partial [Trema orientale]
FSTRDRDNIRTTQNSGVSIVAKTIQFSSSKDKNPIESDVVYYGVIAEIWELDFVTFRLPVFMCQWVESNHGVRKDELGFTLVDLNRIGHKNDPFIMATQAKQVFYVNDPLDARWSIVLATQLKEYQNLGVEDENEILVAHESFSKGISVEALIEDVVEDDVTCLRDDGEGIWIDNQRKKPTR